MKTLSYFRFPAVALAASLAGAVLTKADDVVAPAKRQASLAAARELLAPKEAANTQKNPFFTEAFTEALAASTGHAVASGEASSGATASPAGPRSSRDVLQTIAMSLKPRYMEVGGKPILFFGQKRVNPGSSLTINFEGTEYVLEIVSIDRPNFTLRLNREEFTRPIK
jgi:hypothetical protein